MSNVIEWDKLKYTPLLIKNHEDTINDDRTLVSINGYTIPISNNGIELEWWNKDRIYSEDELKLPIPEYLRDYIQLKEIHLMSGALLEHIFQDHNLDKMVFEEVYDYLRRRNLKMQRVDRIGVQPQEENISPESSIPIDEQLPENIEEGFGNISDSIIEGQAELNAQIATMSPTAGAVPPAVPPADAPNVVTTNDAIVEFASKGIPLLLWNTILGKELPDSPVMNNLEDSINKLMMTEHNDKEHITRIKNFKTLDEYGDPKNRSDLLYLQAKIIRFITLNPKDVFKTLDIVYIIPDDLCEIGLTGDSMKVLAKLLDVDVKVDNKTQMKHTKTVHNLLFKYIPDIMKQIIDISEEYEKSKCNGEIHPNTIMMKDIHKHLFINSNMSSFALPELGISDFFIDFKQNILTKVILLAFIAFVVSKLVSLFKIQYNL